MLDRTLSPIASSAPKAPVYRRTPQRFARTTSAFTLIELLAASAASAMVLIAIFGIFHRAIKTRNGATERAHESAMRTRAANLIRNDLRNAYISGTNAVLASVVEGGLSGQKSHFPGYLRFTTTTGKDTPDEMYGDVQQVEYYISDEAKVDTVDGNQHASHDSGTLTRTITRDLLSTVTEPTREDEILKRVETLEVEFYDGQNWQESWQLSGSSGTSSTNSLTSSSASSGEVPQAIRVRIQQAPASENAPMPLPLEIMVPWTTEPVTSSTASLTGT